MRKLVLLAVGGACPARLVLAGLTAAGRCAGRCGLRTPSSRLVQPRRDAATFDSLSALTASRVGPRGGDVARAEPAATYEEMPALRERQGRPKFRQSVPVWFHVVSDGATGNVLSP